ncbi:MAG TPA: putative LPS assembly protein LptD [Saprospiraceae bacterium]|nr:putative LPS assembly protein LptD [Saprospiraceae bacterium]
MRKLLGKYRFFFQIAALLACTGAVAQVPTDSVPTIRAIPQPGGKQDTLPPGLRDSAIVDLSGIKISDEGVDEEVEYGARDSMWFDVQKKQVHLYGNASVKYTSLNIKAGYILLDWEHNEISAAPLADSSGRLAGYPDFQDGAQNFTAERLRYNFKTRKGIIYEARTKQEDLYVLGERAKFIGAGDSGDSTQVSRNTIYNQDAIITSCDHPNPHFGIHTKKLKVIPDKLVVTGFSVVEVAGIPTPLVLPFGFFPITKTRKAGLIIPKDFEFSDVEGFGLRDFGWYQPISEHMDLSVLFNLYTSGTWGVSGTSRYNKKYAYNGNFLMSFNNRVREDNFANKLSAKSFRITWTHNQDPKAHPTKRFGGTVNIETNKDQNRNYNDYQSVYRNTLTSNLTYSQSFPGKPFQLSASLNHSQNTQTRVMDITLPNVNFTMQRIFPLKRKEAVGKERWYEKISLTYASKFQNKFNTVDTLLFTRKTLEGARLGMQHSASTDFTFKVFKYINVAPRLDYEENWYPYAIEKQLIPEIRYVYDTIRDGDTYYLQVDSAQTQFGVDTTVRDWGFYRFNRYTTGISMNTALFFTQQYKKGWFRGFRHTMKPSASVGFGPDFSKPPYSDYYRTVETDLRQDYNDTLVYNIFDDAIFGRPPSSTTARNIVLSYSLLNVLEFKHYSAKKDTVLKKRIFDGLAFNGNYNFTADSLNWSEISTGGLFRFFKGIVNLTWNARFDPYLADAKGQRVNTFVAERKAKIVRTTAFGVQLNTVFTVKQLRDVFAGKDNDPAPQPQQSPQAARPTVKDDLFGWFNDFRINYSVSVDRRLIPTGFGEARDTFAIGRNSISFSGSIPLTSKWALQIGHVSYDFQSKQLVYPDLGLTRDLHCWQLSLYWQPERGTYLFSINVKPGSFDFLKVPYRKNNYDAGL